MRNTFSTFVDSSKTTSKVVSGVTVWSNPDINVDIDSKGRVFRKKTGEIVPIQKQNRLYSFQHTTRSGNVRKSAASFNSLYAHMVLGKVLSGHTLMLKEKELGFTPENVEVVSVVNACQLADTAYKVGRPKLADLIGSKAKEVTEKPKGESADTLDHHGYFTVVEKEAKFVTEDGAVFPTRQLAEWHQDKVSKGKGNAQVVLNFNGGYVLAEEIYKQEVVYLTEKPYLNFVDVMKNNSGIYEEAGCSYAIFNRGALPANACLDFLLGVEFKIEVAQQIAVGIYKYTKLLSEVNAELSKIQSLSMFELAA